MTKIDHIGIAVKNLEESLEKWEDLFGLKARKIEELKERNVRLVHLDLEEGPSVELVSPRGEESPLAKFIKERGEGIHHFCFKVKNIERVMKDLKKKGIQFVQEKPQIGAGGSLIAFIHPANINGVLIELKEGRD
jgi:methylmalonyl-CoA/ethylmalonyl-CoA epimerase